MKKILLLLFLCYLKPSLASDTMQLTIPNTQSTFVISLAANPTTGYQWSVVGFDKKVFKLVSNTYLPSRSDLIGAGGVMQFKFALIKGKGYPKSSTMVFKYARPWEKKGGTVQDVFIQFF